MQSRIPYNQAIIHITISLFILLLCKQIRLLLRFRMPFVVNLRLWFFNQTIFRLELFLSRTHVDVVIKIWIEKSERWNRTWLVQIDKDKLDTLECSVYMYLTSTRFSRGNDVYSSFQFSYQNQRKNDRINHSFIWPTYILVSVIAVHHS